MNGYVVSEIKVPCEKCKNGFLRMHANNEEIYIKCDSCGYIEKLPQINSVKKEDDNMIFDKWLDLKKAIKSGDMQEAIENAKESMAYSKKIVKDRILDRIQDAKKEGYLYCKYVVKQTEIDLNQAEEVMDYLISIGYDIYKNMLSGDMAMYTKYTIFWDDESSGKYRNEDVKWVIKEGK